MEAAAEFACPWCGQIGTVSVDTGTACQRFTVDCEVCCRPVELVATCEPGEILSLEVGSG